jgi:hypothetical protein
VGQGVTDLVVAIRDRDENGKLRNAASEMQDQLKAGLIGPVYVLDDERHWRGVRPSRHELEERAEQVVLVPGLVGSVRLAYGSGQLGEELLDRRATVSHESRPRRFRACSQQTPRELQPGGIRQSSIWLETIAAKDLPTLISSSASILGDEPGLSDSCLPADEDCVAPPVPSGRGEAVEVFTVAMTPDQDRAYKRLAERHTILPLQGG